MGSTPKNKAEIDEKIAELEKKIIDRKSTMQYYKDHVKDYKKSYFYMSAQSDLTRYKKQLVDLKLARKSAK